VADAEALADLAAALRALSLADRQRLAALLASPAPDGPDVISQGAEGRGIE
jgi:hypothetical protein